MDLSPYLVQVLDPLGEVEGTGFVCHPEGYALTCWHVIEKWLQAPVRGKGSVAYQGEHVAAELVEERSAPAADLAVLRLSHPQSAKAKRNWPYLPLDVDWRVGLQDTLHSFGYPEGQFAQSGISVNGKIGGLEPMVKDGIVIFPITGFAMDNVHRGYSGAPVANEATQKVIGLVRLEHHEAQAFIIPLAPLFAVWPELYAEHDVFERIRQRLEKNAKAKLGEKLRGAPFIPLSLEAGVIPKKGEREDKTESGLDVREHAHGRRWEAFHVQRLLPPKESFVLISDVGTGKTTFLYWLASELAQKRRFVPLEMSCEELERVDPASLKELVDLFIARHVAEFQRVDLEAFFTRAEKQGKLTLLFDGLDQVPSGKPSAVARLAFSFANRCRVVLTSRPSAVSRAIEKDSNLTLLRLQPFSLEDQRRYFGKLYAQARDACTLAPDLIGVPMLAYMVRELLRVGGIKVAATRTELYGKFVHHVLTEHEANLPLLDEAGLSGKVQRALEAFAFKALANAQPRIQRVPIEDYTDEAHVSLSSLISFGLINRIVDRGEEALYFTHQSFQEFLAAQYAADKVEGIDQLIAERWHPKWAEVIRFLAGLKGELIIEKILTQPENVIHANLCLAASCATEVKTLSASQVASLEAKLYELAGIEPFRTDAIAALLRVHYGFNVSDHERTLHFLCDKNGEVRRVALKTLGSLGARVDVETVREIVGCLRDEDEDVRCTALKTLGSLGGQLEAETVREIVGRLRDERLLVREAAAKALGSLGGQLEAETVREIVGYLRDESEHVRRAAAEALGSLAGQLEAETVREIVGYLRDESEHVRRAALSALGSLGGQLEAETVREIVDRLRDEDEGVREIAVRALGSLDGQLEAETVREIVGRLRDESEHVRRAAVEVLGSLAGQLEAETVREIVGRLRDESEHVRRTAVEVLGSLGGQLEAETVREIVGRLRDESSWVREAAAKALGSLAGQLEAETVREIVGCLRDEDEGVREIAVQTLGSLGGQLEAETVREIVGRLRDESEHVRRAALKTLGSLGGQLEAETVREIVGCLRDEDDYVCQTAAEALGSLAGQLEAETVREIVGLLRDADAKVRAEAVLALGFVGFRGGQLEAETVRKIVGLLRDEHEGVRRAAVFALACLSAPLNAEIVREIVAQLRCTKGIGQIFVPQFSSFGTPVDAGTVREIVGLLRDENEDVREAAAEALGSLAAWVDAKTVRELVGRLRDEAGKVRRASVAALQSALAIGKSPLTLKAIPTIVGLLDHPDVMVRHDAYIALRRLYNSGIPLPAENNKRENPKRRWRPHPTCG